MNHADLSVQWESYLGNNPQVDFKKNIQSVEEYVTKNWETFMSIVLKHKFSWVDIGNELEMDPFECRKAYLQIREIKKKSSSTQNDSEKNHKLEIITPKHERKKSFDLNDFSQSLIQSTSFGAFTLDHIKEESSSDGENFDEDPTMVEAYRSLTKQHELGMILSGTSEDSYSSISSA